MFLEVVEMHMMWIHFKNLQDQNGKILDYMNLPRWKKFNMISYPAMCHPLSNLLIDFNCPSNGLSLLHGKMRTNKYEILLQTEENYFLTSTI